MIFPVKRVKEELERGYLRDTCLTGGSKTCLFSDRFFFAKKNVSEDLRKHWINPIENFS